MMNPNNLVYNPMAFSMLLNYMNTMFPNMGYNINNYNIYNADYNKMLMINWMSMNPFLATLYQNLLNQININICQPQFPSPSPSPSNSYNMNSNSNSNTSTYNISPNTESPKINLAFTTQKGKKLNMICSHNMKIKDLFVEYVKKLGLGPGIIGNEFYFLHNGLVSQNDERTVGELGLNSGYNIIVIDTKDIIGA